MHNILWICYYRIGGTYKSHSRGNKMECKKNEWYAGDYEFHRIMIEENEFIVVLVANVNHSNVLNFILPHATICFSKVLIQMTLYYNRKLGK